MEIRTFGNVQCFDFAGLKGRHLSNSSVSLPGHPQYEAMIADLRELFDTFQEGGRVRFLYNTRLYYGSLG